MSHERLTKHRYFVDLGPLTLEENFESGERMTFTVVAGGGMVPDGYVETVAITAVEIRPDVFLTSWTEESGANIVHLEDFERGVVHSRITLPDGTPLALTGTIKPLG
ncbi:MULTISPECIES: MoaF-related domain-containing protein [Streptomyces]|uniref:MoaF-like domain-containing protein n=1 Tax=Streptomyces flaveolus TaxID=67297 RepID=A0ABV3AMI7_9ACTN|nr:MULTISPECIES: hypothetical protein [Streptomyces]KOG74274.1 hypothetical protein ADK77_06080 [Streptomyces antibioticus]